MGLCLFQKKLLTTCLLKFDTELVDLVQVQTSSLGFVGQLSVRLYLLLWPCAVFSKFFVWQAWVTFTKSYFWTIQLPLVIFFPCIDCFRYFFVVVISTQVSVCSTSLFLITKNVFLSKYGIKLVCNTFSKMLPAARTTKGSGIHKQVS